MEEKPPAQHPIINCHTHIFTGDHVPPHLARTFVWWPFYYILSLPLILWGVKLYNKTKDAILFSPTYRSMQRAWYKFSIWMNRTWLLNILQGIIGIWAVMHVFYILYDWIYLVIRPDDSVVDEWIVVLRSRLEEWHILYTINSLFLKVVLVGVVLLFFTAGRRFILFVLKRLWGFFQLLPGKLTTQLIERYLLLGRFSMYKHQRGVMARLRAQYPPGTGFVVLPMDMEYMGAGKLNPKHNFYRQMEGLADLKQREGYRDILFPFVFADPRRIRQDPTFFQYSAQNGQVKLEDCFIKEYIEEHQFSGFKIYPALGYFPFEEELLPLWKYAADRGLPITTHCIRGTIFYRGAKKPEWDIHPVFEELGRDGSAVPLLLPERKNEAFQLNFTHPMNYLCLLEESLLRRLVGKARDPRIFELFGYNGPDKALDHDLSHLKICFAHFGGEDQWEKYLELDRYNYSMQLIRNPERGIIFLYNRTGEYSPAKIEQVWKYADWYSIICSIMLQYDNVYSDISYILHNETIFPLLKQTLLPDNEKLRSRVLYGTDFYVVRNHKSDKQLVADVLSELDKEEFDLIARENPRAFLGLN